MATRGSLELHEGEFRQAAPLPCVEPTGFGGQSHQSQDSWHRGTYAPALGPVPQPGQGQNQTASGPGSVHTCQNTFKGSDLQGGPLQGTVCPVPPGWASNKKTGIVDTSRQTMGASCPMTPGKGEPQHTPTKVRTEVWGLLRPTAQAAAGRQRAHSKQVGGFIVTAEKGRAKTWPMRRDAGLGGGRLHGLPTAARSQRVHATHKHFPLQKVSTRRMPSGHTGLLPWACWGSHPQLDSMP